MTKRNSETRREQSEFNGKTITRYEKIDPYKLNYIIDNHDSFNLHELFHSRSGAPLTRDAQVTLLRKYLKQLTNDVIKVVYKQGLTCIGRYNARGALSLACIKRSVRHSICREYYDDFDIVNANPCFLDQYLTENEVAHPCLEYYVEHRDALFAEMTDSQNMSRDEVKELVLKIMNGGEIKPDELRVYPESIRNFHTEMKVIRAEVMGLEPGIVDKARRKKKKNNQTEWNLSGSVMNPVLCDIENLVLMNVDRYLSELGYAVDVLVFDGLMVRKNELKPIDAAVLQGCSDYVKEQTGYKCAILVKPMNELLEIPDPPEYSPYQKMQMEFELHHFKCTGEARFYDTSHDMVRIRTISDLKTSYGHLRVLDHTQKDPDQSFIDYWLKDPNMQLRQPRDQENPSGASCVIHVF